MGNPNQIGDCDDFDIHDSGFATNPYPTYTDLRENCPVHRSEHHDGFWLLSRYDDVKSAVLNWRAFTSAVAGVTAIPIITQRTKPQLPLELDPPQHSRYRALVNPVFSSARIEALRPRIKSIAESYLKKLVASGGGDAVTDFAIPLSVETMATFTGLPESDSDKWVSWIRRMFNVHDALDSQNASQAFGAYIDKLIAERRVNPSDDFIGLLMDSEIEGQRLTDDEIHSFCTLLFGAGFETTADALSVMLLQLATCPDDFERLKSEPELIPTAVEEYVRYASPIQIFGRNASNDLDLHGKHITQGDVVALSFGSANHDPTIFEHPDQCVLDRAPNKHLAFGAGIHLCLGAPVARLEMQITLEVFSQYIKTLTVNGDVIWKIRGDRRGLEQLPLRLSESQST